MIVSILTNIGSLPAGVAVTYIFANPVSGFNVTGVDLTDVFKPIFIAEFNPRDYSTIGYDYGLIMDI
jgi:hypothetical protein